MPDFLKESFAADPPVKWLEVLVRLVVATLVGAGVAWIYKKTRRRADIAVSFPPTLVLLATLIAMVTQVVGGSTARAFALVGALSIVRFRTVVRDTQDTAWVIFAVIVGMSVGAGNMWVATIGLVVVGIAAFLMRRSAPDEAGPTDVLPFILRVRTGLGADIKTLLAETLAANTSERRLQSMETAKQGISIDATYEVALRSSDSAESLVKSINRLEGVQDVRIERRGVIDD